MEEHKLPAAPLGAQWVCPECFLKFDRTQVLLRDREETEVYRPDRRLRRHLVRLYGAEAPSGDTLHPLLDWRTLPPAAVTLRSGEPQWSGLPQTAWAARGCPVCHGKAPRLLMGQRPVCTVAAGTKLLRLLRGQLGRMTAKDRTAEWPGLEPGRWYRQSAGWCDHWVRRAGEGCQWLTLPRRLPQAEPAYLAELQANRIRQAGGFLLLLEAAAPQKADGCADDAAACRAVRQLQAACADLTQLRRVPAAAVVLLAEGEPLEEWRLRHPGLVHLVQDTFAQPHLLAVSAGQPDEAVQAVLTEALDRLGGIAPAE